MIKQNAHFWRRRDLPFDRFRDHYETDHAPLVIRHGGQYLADYRRNFVDRGLPGNARGAAPYDFDVITQVWFDTEAELTGLASAWTDPAIGKLIAEDEERFFDRNRMQVYMVDERVTPSAELGAANGGTVPPIKCALLQERSPDLAYGNFVEWYEEEYVQRLIAALPMLAGFRRSFTIPGGSFEYPHVTEKVPPPRWSVMTEMWFRREGDYEQAVATLDALLREPLFAKDPAPLFRLDERISRLA